MFSSSGFILLLLAGWVVYYSLDSSPEKSLHPPKTLGPATNASELVTLSSEDNLNAWRKASERGRSELSARLATKVGLPMNASEPLKICISETARDGGLDQLRISEVAAACIVLFEQN